MHCIQDFELIDEKLIGKISDMTEEKIMTTVEASYGNFAPLAARLVEVASTDRWDMYEPALRKYVKGDSKNSGNIHELSQSEKQALKKKGFTRLLDKNASHTLVVFVGGCTRAEIAAVRTLAKTHKKRYHILTTAVISGSTLLDSLDVTWKA